MSNGNVWKFGENINTDEIIPARYLNTSDKDELAKHCMEDADPEFASKVEPGDYIVAGKNFGCGSSREHAPIAIKAAGLAGVIAPSFARIFFRNAINMGLPIYESSEAAEALETGDVIDVDMTAGTIRASNNRAFSFKPYPQEIKEIIDAGGLMAYTAKTLG
jgi:3-isopropylmalate/(R)-2-methylmalate dehydratase small subunit